MNLLEAVHRDPAPDEPRFTSATVSREAPDGSVTVSLSLAGGNARRDPGLPEEAARRGGVGAVQPHDAGARAADQLIDRALADDPAVVDDRDRVQVRSTSSSRCEESITVRPSPTSERIIARISCIPAGSSPFIGSSRISSSGSPSRHAATPRRWRMPIEYETTLSSAAR